MTLYPSIIVMLTEFNCQGLAFYVGYRESSNETDLQLNSFKISSSTYIFYGLSDEWFWFLLVEEQILFMLILRHWCRIQKQPQRTTFFFDIH